MYTIERTSNHGFDFGTIVFFYRDGKLVGTRLSGEPIRLEPQYIQRFDPLTRAKAFRYSRKYFPNRAVWDLPLLLEEATYLPSTSKGSYINRNGEMVGYEG